MRCANPIDDRVGFATFHSGRVAEWQTRTVQVRVSVRTWGFNSPLAHPVRCCRTFPVSRFVLEGDPPDPHGASSFRPSVDGLGVDQPPFLGDQSPVFGVDQHRLLLFSLV